MEPIVGLPFVAFSCLMFVLICRFCADAAHEAIFEDDRIEVGV